MCAYCMRSTCPPGCPSYNPRAKATCTECGASLFNGSTIVKIDGKTYCWDCISEMDTRSILALFDVYPEDLDEEPDW